MELVRWQDELSCFQLSHPRPDKRNPIQIPRFFNRTSASSVDSSSRFVGTIKRLIARSFVRGMDLCVRLWQRLFDRKTRPSLATGSYS